MKIESDQNQLKLSGSVFIQESELLMSALKELLRFDKRQIQINLDQVEAIDTGVLQILLAAQRSAKQQGKTLQFTPISAQVTSIMKKTGLDPLFFEENLSVNQES